MSLLAVAAALSLVAFALSALLCGLARRVAPRFGLVDRPGGRKGHKAPTPLGGGVAIWATMLLVLLGGAVIAKVGAPWLPTGLRANVPGALGRLPDLAWSFCLATLIMAMGLADDRIGLGWKLRIAIQFALASFFVLTADNATIFLPMPALTRLLTIIWIVGLTNAFNFLDNMDGLAASVALIAAALFAGAQVAVGGLFVPAVLLVLIGALAGFLVHNRPPARLFMGDAGSNFLGFLLGTLTVLGTFTKAGYSRFAVLAPLLAMAVPLYDATSVVLIRLREGRSPFQADRRHLSHRLVDRGLTPGRAVATIDLITLLCGLGALVLHRAGAFEAGVIAAQAACALALVALLEVSTRGPERPNGQAQPGAAAPPTDPHASNGPAT